MVKVVNGTQVFRDLGSWHVHQIVFISAECVVSLLTVVTNSLVLAAVVLYPSLRKPSNWFVVNLAVADLFVGVLVPPLAILSETSVIKDFHLCILSNSMAMTFMTNSFMSLVCLVYDRFTVIHNAFHTSTPESVVAKLGLSWVVSFIVGMAPLMGWHKKRSEYRRCAYREVIPLEFNVYLQTFGFLVPFLLAMLIVHILVFRKFRKSNRLMAYSSHNSHTLIGSRTRREKRLFESLALIFILFAVCWMPLSILSSIRLFWPEVEVSIYTELFFVTLTHTNSLVNPVVYALGQNEFRQVLRMLFPVLFTTDSSSAGSSQFTGQKSFRNPTTLRAVRRSSCFNLPFTDSPSWKSITSEGRTTEVRFCVDERDDSTQLPGPEENSPASVKSGGTRLDDVRTIESTTNNDTHASPLSEMYMSSEYTPSYGLTQDDKQADQTEPKDTPASVTKDDEQTHLTKLNKTPFLVPGPCNTSTVESTEL